MWVYTTGKSEDKNIILYDYKEGRSGKYAAEFLKGFTGYVHCDGWNGYDKVENIKRVGCWAHARRYFKGSDKCAGKHQGLFNRCGAGIFVDRKIFSTEDKITDAEEIKKIRETKGKEAVNGFFNFCETAEALPKSLTGKAVSYAINQKII